MNFITALQWRYATKRMTGAHVPHDKMELILDAISLAPTSFGLQPYSVLVIEDKALLAKIKPIAMGQPQITEAAALLVFAAWDQVTFERIDAYFQLMAHTRKVPIESLEPMRAHIDGQINLSKADQLVWNAKQTYIALGIAMVAAAEQHIDSTPMEGFNNAQLDELLQLPQKGLRSTVLLALGYRDEANDYLVHLKKVRRSKEDLFIRL
ncbi:MAG: NAD(P)H-dependent oxidoreductase [Flavobacterium sp. BFFFF2]|nr:MAG: NAD(P)H-dependent oxidoreductase [Flavobacterium sp. BFFFF2]